jgi:hypothetical protein
MSEQLNGHVAKFLDELGSPDNEPWLSNASGRGHFDVERRRR